MKPDQEMHVAMEEPELEPCDLFVDIGLLVIEGRTPLPTSRGYGEGPHCVPPYPSAVQKSHTCNPLDVQCIQQENFRKHMMLLWKNSIPMSIEVLLCPDCCYGDEKPGEAAGPEPNFILVEQWMVQMVPRRAPEANITARALLQAVRSYLHFSQLSAWYSLTAGKAPKNVVYRVCVPGEVFSNKFNKLPDEHMFPMANVGWNNVFKVSVKAMPRNNAIPDVPCPLHDPIATAPIPRKGTRKSPPLEAGRCSPDDHEEMRRRVMASKVVDGIDKKDGSPSELMLGDSLLDPPQLLEMYPKRYQSPSRSGSPVMETPEHWMFGGCGQRGRATHRATESRSGSPTERGRPWHKKEQRMAMNRGRDDVAQERNGRKYHMGKLKDLEEECCISDYKCDLGLSPKSNYTNCKKSFYDLSPEETVHVLHAIRQRQTYPKTDSYRKMSDESIKNLLPMSPKHTECNSTTDERRSYCKEKKSDCVDINNFFLRTKPSNPPASTPSTNDCFSHSQQKCARMKGQSGLPLSPLVYNSTSSISLVRNWLSQDTSKTSSQCSYPPRRKETCACKLSPKFSSYLCDQHNSNKTVLSNTELDSSDAIGDYFGIKPNCDCNNENELSVSNWAGCGDDPRKHLATNIENEHHANWFLTYIKDGLHKEKSERLLDDVESLDSEQKVSEEEECNGNGDNAVHCQGRKEVPSARAKAKFRRSLDSAANLVFHSFTGLPLTSSPAPMRKGTRFDFDSSLTSVSAIKFALFDKDEVEKSEEALRPLSTSAPSTIANNSSLLGNFEESVLNGRLEPFSTVEGFTAEIGASGAFCPRHIILPVTVFFYTLTDADKVSTPYLGHINLGKKGYHVPKCGTIQVTLFNPHGTVVKMFVAMYDLRDMAPRCQTFLRQRTLYMPIHASDEDPEARKWLRYLIHLRFASSKSGRIYLHTDIRLVIFRKSDMDAATVYGSGTYELRSFTKGPTNPRFSPRR